MLQWLVSFCKMFWYFDSLLYDISNGRILLDTRVYWTFIPAFICIIYIYIYMEWYVFKCMIMSRLFSNHTDALLVFQIEK